MIIKHVSLILIDPQVGFCSPNGSLAKAYGAQELSKIREALLRIPSAIDESERRHVVASRYMPGQFTEGDLRHELVFLCVPSANNDCALVREFAHADFHSRATKSKPSALSSPEFCLAVEQDMAIGIRTFALAGFLIEHCVRATAEALKTFLPDADIVVCSDLCASRLEKYNNGVVDKAVEDLSTAGVCVKLWKDI